MPFLRSTTPLDSGSFGLSRSVPRPRARRPARPDLRTDGRGGDPPRRVPLFEMERRQPVAGYLIVRHQLVQVDLAPGSDAPCVTCGRIHRCLVFGPTTANGGARRVDLSQMAVAALLEHHLRQAAEREQLGDAYVDHGLVFADVDGNPWKPDHVPKTFARLQRQSGLRKTRLHDLRHAWASLMLAGGVDIAIVSKSLGHANIRITSDTHSHLSPGVGARAAEAADALIVRKPPDQSVTNQAQNAVEAAPPSRGAASELRSLSPVEAIGRCGNRRPRVQKLVSTWNQGIRENVESEDGVGDLLIRASAEPKQRPRTRLTEGEVDAIRTARARGVSVNALARQFGVHRATVWAKTQ